MGSIQFDTCCPLCGGTEFARWNHDTVVTWLNLRCSDCGLLCEVQVGAESPTLSDSLEEWRTYFPDD